MIPVLKSYEYDEIDAEVVLKNNKQIISAIIVDGMVDELIKI